MGSYIADAVRQLQAEKNISEELVIKTIEETMLAAYKRHFASASNAVIKFSDDLQYVYLYAKKTIVEDDDWDNPYEQIEISEAKALNENAEIGDEILIEVDPKTFGRVDIQTAKQRTRQDLREIQKDTLYSEYKDKVGEIIIGYHQRDHRGSMYIDLGKTEGILPKRFQSPRESYQVGDKVKALIREVKRSPTGLAIILSRTHAEFVKRILELEIPEIYDGTVEIYKIVREPGYRTKLAVYSLRPDIDPVGACVGARGQRIQNVVRELEGEKIDVLLYEEDVTEFIRNALAPAKVLAVYVMDPQGRKALAVLAEDQLSLAIGKNGLNVRLANRLVDWNIDVKTEAQVSDMDLDLQNHYMPEGLFHDEQNDQFALQNIENMDDRLIEMLRANGVEFSDTLFALRTEELSSFSGMTSDDLAIIEKIINENNSNEITSESHSTNSEEAQATEEVVLEGVNDGEDELYECPECGGNISIEMTECPTCGVGLSFEEEEA